MVITAFTTAHHRFQSWASRIQSTTPANLPKIHSDPIYALVFQVVSFFRAFSPKPCTLFPPFPCVPHVVPTSFALTCDNFSIVSICYSHFLSNMFITFIIRNFVSWEPQCCSIILFCSFIDVNICMHAWVSMRIKVKLFSKRMCYKIPYVYAHS
jgi:hypothetical protein